MRDDYIDAFQIALKALRRITEEANAFQGEWDSVTLEMAPSWTHGLKTIENLADDALAQIENLSVNEYTEKAEPLPNLSSDEQAVLVFALSDNGAVVYQTADDAAKATLLVERGFLAEVYRSETVFVGILTASGRSLAQRLHGD